MIPLVAQCVMCFRTAASQQAARAEVLNVGILILGIPPVLILGAFCWLAWRRSRSYGESAPEPAAYCAPRNSST